MEQAMALAGETGEPTPQLRVKRKGSGLRRLGWAKRPEAEEMAQSLYPAFIGKDDVVVEVGADVGGGTLLLSRIAKQVYAFEPNPYSFSSLEAAAKKEGNVQVFNLGAGSKDETVRMKLPQLAEMPRGSRSAPVHLVRVDSVGYSLAPTCLVVDCGGSELESLKGSEGLFRSRYIWTVLMETHQLPNGTNTATETPLWLIDHGLKARTRQASDGSIWVIATTNKRTVYRVETQGENTKGSAGEVPVARAQTLE